MKTVELIKKSKYVSDLIIGTDGGRCLLQLFPKSKKAIVIFSWGDGWDHVSASYNNRCLTWEEMCLVKSIFFDENETVVQYHPSKENYVKNHPYTLHLWKPQKRKIPIPPKYMV